MNKVTVDREQAIKLWKAGIKVSTDHCYHPNVTDLIYWLEKQGKYDWPRYLYNINYHPDDNELINELVDLCLDWAEE